MSGAHRLWIGGADDSVALARLHAGALPDAWPDAAFASLLSRGEVFVLLGTRAGGASAEGFILVRVVVGEAEVLTFCAASAARRSGLGRALLEAAFAEAQRRGAEKVFLEVGENNAAALALYQKSGFVAVGRRAAYYRHGSDAVDAIVMQRSLGDVKSAGASGSSVVLSAGPGMD